MCNFIEDDPQPDVVLERCKFIKQKLDKMQRSLEKINKQISNVNILKIDQTIQYMIKEQQETKEEMNKHFEKNNLMLLKIRNKLT